MVLVCECVCVDELQFALSTPEVLKIMDATSVDPEFQMSAENVHRSNVTSSGVANLLGIPTQIKPNRTLMI